MKTDWNGLKGKKVLIKFVYRDRWIKTYSGIREMEVINVVGSCIKFDSGLNEWTHRDGVKLVEIIQ